MTQAVRVVVDGESFDVLRQNSSIHLTWISGPTASYGFSVGGSCPTSFTDEELHSAIRAFLSGIDPHTGYLAE